jgi:hypothetical protein
MFYILKKYFTKYFIVFEGAFHNLTLSLSHLRGSHSHVVDINQYRKFENTKVGGRLVLWYFVK